MIIGLTGTISAGKGTVANYLLKKGFRSYSLSNELREIMKRQAIEPTRKNMIEFGTKLRKEKGNNYLAKIVAKKVKGNAVIDSIRHPEEAKELKKIPGFYLIAIDAPIKKRYERSILRNRAGDAKTFEEFKELESKEMNSKGSGQNLKEVMEIADKTIINNENTKKLYRIIDSIIE